METEGRAELWALKNSCQAGVWMPAHPLLDSQRAELSTASIPPSLAQPSPSVASQCRRAHNSSRDLRPDPIPSMPRGHVCVCHSQHIRTPCSVELHLPLSSLVCGNPDLHPSYSCYKRTHVCHFTKNCRALWTGHLPRISDIRLELQKPCFCVSFWKHTYDIKRDVSA